MEFGAGMKLDLAIRDKPGDGCLSGASSLFTFALANARKLFYSCRRCSRAYYSRSGKSGKRRCCSRSHLGTPESCSIRVTAVPITRDWASHKFLSLHYAARTLEPKYFRRIAGTRITRWIASQRCPKCAGQKLRLGSK